MKILGGCLGECIHVAGILNFLHLAASFGHRTEFLGPAIPIRRFVEELCRHRPELTVMSYRLTPEVAEGHFAELKQELQRRDITEVRFAFGGTPAVAKVAQASGLFEVIFSGEESPEEVVAYLKGESCLAQEQVFAQTLTERIQQQSPFPLLRHHLGLETVKKTVEHARRIAASKELDILSLAPDQNAQEYFFRPSEMPRRGQGAGGVPLRTPEDMRAIYQATRCGNFPLLRCYGGTRDLRRWARMSVETINIAWGAIPLFWYSQLDKRADRVLVDAIQENQAAMRWYAKHKIPVEVNDAHQWSLRDAHDTVAVAAAYLAAYNAKKLGVRYYVSQYMLNTPLTMSPAMDLAKMLAKIEMIEALHDEHFFSYRQIRTGLMSMVPDPNLAKGHLAASITLGMCLKPHIVHVVGYCEADHAATAKEIIESCQLTRGAILLALKGLPDVFGDPAIQRRKRRLIKDAMFILDVIRNLAKKKDDPLTDPEVLSQSVHLGIFDAPHLVGSGIAPGRVTTRSLAGQCVAVNPRTGKPLTEQKRLAHLR